MEDPRLPTRKEQDKFYVALGRAITNWSSLESQLFEITHLILGCARGLASVVFYRTPTIDSRLTLTTDLVEFILPNYGPGVQIPMMSLGDSEIMSLAVPT